MTKANSFLSGKTHYGVEFLFLQSFQSVKWPFERVATCVRRVFWFSAVNNTSTSNQLPQVDFVIQSCLASARVHS